MTARGLSVHGSVKGFLLTGGTAMPKWTPGETKDAIIVNATTHKGLVRSWAQRREIARNGHTSLCNVVQARMELVWIAKGIQYLLVCRRTNTSAQWVHLGCRRQLRLLNLQD